MKRNKKVFLFASCLFLISLFIANLTWERGNEEKQNKEKIVSYYEEKETKKETYLGILSIPRIGLKRGFYEESSPLNQVNKNIMLIYNKMPSLLVLAAHRGSSKVAFFNGLDKMKIGDSIHLSYKHQEYEYIYLDAYKVNKDGNVPISYDTSQKTLILITCSKEDKQKQIVYLAYLKDKENGN